MKCRIWDVEAARAEREPTCWGFLGCDSESESSESESGFTPIADSRLRSGVVARERSERRRWRTWVGSWRA